MCHRAVGVTTSTSLGLWVLGLKQLGIFTWKIVGTHYVLVG